MNEYNSIKTIIGEYLKIKALDIGINKRLDIMHKYATDRIYKDRLTNEDRLVALKLMVKLMENHIKEQHENH